MKLETLATIVAIIYGVSQTIKIWQEIIKNLKSKPSGESTPSSQLGSPFLRLIISFSMLLFLLGGFLLAYGNIQIPLDKQACLQGYDPSYYKIINTCGNYANSKHEGEIRYGLIAICASFVTAATTLFFQRFKTATSVQFFLEIILLAVGAWLIISNL